MVKRCLPLLILILAATASATGPVAPIRVKLKQPDGTAFVGVPRGNGYVNWMETGDGHSVVRSTGRWFYAELGGDGRLRASRHQVGSLTVSQLRALPRHLRPRASTSRFEVYSPRTINDRGGAAAGGFCARWARPGPNRETRSA